MAMNDHVQLAVFRVGEWRLALPLASVQRVVRAVEVTALPNAPAIVLGLIDVAGTVLPVLNLRQRLGLATQPVTPDDQFLIARTKARTVVLVIDEAMGVRSGNTVELAGTPNVLRGSEHIQGVVRLEDGLVLIQDLEKFLSSGEALALDQAMRKEAHA